MPFNVLKIDKNRTGILVIKTRMWKTTVCDFRFQNTIKTFNRNRYFNLGVKDCIKHKVSQTL